MATVVASVVVGALDVTAGAAVVAGVGSTSELDVELGAAVDEAGGA